MSELEKLLKKIDRKNNEIILTGDMNLDLLKFATHLPTASYLDIAAQHGLVPKIVRPTRIKKQSAPLIDHIFTRDNIGVISSGIINAEIAGNSGYTEHFPIFTILPLNTGKARRNEVFEKRYFIKTDTEERKKKD